MRPHLPSCPVIALIAMIGVGFGVSAATAAQLAPEVVANAASGRSQSVLIHLVAESDARLPLEFGSDGADQRRLQAVARAVDGFLRTKTGDEIELRRAFRLQPTVAARIASEDLATLAEDPRVRLVEPDRVHRLQTAEGLELIAADQLHQMGISGEGTAIAILDSGVDYLHPTLGGGQIPNAKVVYGLDTGDDDNDPMDCNGHGTAVASIAAGSSHQWSPGRRFAGGVAPAARILAYKVTSDDSCGVASTGAIVAAIEDAVLRRDGDGYRLAAINISLGAGEFTGTCDAANPAYAAAVNTAIDAGIAVVTAAGNNGLANGMNVPACLTGALAVGSAWDVDPGWIPFSFCLDPECERWCDDSFRYRRSIACYSNSSPFLDLIAPSEYLKVAQAGAVTTEFGGTSGAAAYVSGAAALITEALGDLDPTATRLLLAATGAPAMDDKNGLIRPLVDLGAAVEAAERVGVSVDGVQQINRHPEEPTTSTLFVNQTGPVGHVDVLLDIVHPQPAELRLTLTAPDGTAVRLHDGGPGAGGISGSYPNDLEPVESLGRLIGSPMQGAWTLTIEDLRSGSYDDLDAVLVAWGLAFAEISGPPFRDTAMVFPVVAHVDGAHGTAWRSDLRLFNRFPSEDASIRMTLNPPSGSDAFPPRQTNVVVPHGTVVAFDDVVSSRFGLESGQGSLLIEDPAGLVTIGTSRTYTTGEGGTFGQFVAPVVGASTAVGAGDPALIVLPAAGPDHRINLGLTEVAGKPVTAAVTLLDSNTGVALGPSIFARIEAFANLQLNSVLTNSALGALDSADDPYIAVTAVQGQGRITTYGSVIDNHSGDAVFIDGLTPQVTPYVMIPVVARNEGQAGTRWRTDLRVLNHGKFSIHVDAELRLQYSFGVPAITESFELQPGQAITIEDVVGHLFGFSEAVGSLRLVPREGDAALTATSRTANHGGAVGTYGQYVPALVADTGLREAGVLLHIDKGPDTRSNVGVVETSGKSVGIGIRLLNRYGNQLGVTLHQTLGAWESIQINDIFAAVGVSGAENARVEVSRESGAGAFFAYASVIDAHSGDAVFVPVRTSTSD